MKLKKLYSGQSYTIVATFDGTSCPVKDFLTTKDENIVSYAAGFDVMLKHIAANGFESAPVAWTHLASNKKAGVYELIKGPYRLFYFKGEGNMIAVCTIVTRKHGQKADKGSVNLSITKKSDYQTAIQDGHIEITED